MAGDSMNPRRNCDSCAMLTARPDPRRPGHVRRACRAVAWLPPGVLAYRQRFNAARIAGEDVDRAGDCPGWSPPTNPGGRARPGDDPSWPA